MIKFQNALSTSYRKINFESVTSSKPKRLACALLMGVVAYNLLRYMERIPFLITKNVSRSPISLVGAAITAKITYDRISSPPSPENDLSHSVPTQPTTTPTPTNTSPLRTTPAPSKTPTLQGGNTPAHLYIDASNIGKVTNAERVRNTQSDLNRMKNKLCELQKFRTISPDFNGFLTNYETLLTEMSNKIDENTSEDSNSLSLLQLLVGFVKRIEDELLKIINNKNLSISEIANLRMLNIHYALDYLILINPNAQIKVESTFIDGDGKTKINISTRMIAKTLSFKVSYLIENCKLRKLIASQISSPSEPLKS